MYVHAFYIFQIVKKISTESKLVLIRLPLLALQDVSLSTFVGENWDYSPHPVIAKLVVFFSVKVQTTWLWKNWRQHKTTNNAATYVFVSSANFSITCHMIYFFRDKWCLCHHRFRQRKVPNICQRKSNWSGGLVWTVRVVSDFFSPRGF